MQRSRSARERRLARGSRRMSQLARAARWLVSGLGRFGIKGAGGLTAAPFDKRFSGHVTASIP